MVPRNLSFVKTPPQAPGLPLLGNIVEFRQDPLGFLRRMQAEHGDVVGLALGPMKTVLLSHPDYVEDILVTRNRLWLKDRFLQTTLKPVLGEGLLSSEGDFWRRQRRLSQPAFHRERIASYGEIMVRHTEKLAREWRDGAQRDVHKDMMRLTLEIVAEALFGASVGNQADVVGEALEAIQAVVSNPLELFFPALRRLPTRSRRRFKRAVGKLDAIIYELVDRRRKGSSPATNDFLSMLLDAKDEDGSSMSDLQLRDECMTLFLAGHETTALVLSWTWLLLSKHPKVRTKLTAEIDDVLGDRSATISDVPRLKYTAFVINEALRLYPPAWSMGREAKEDVEIAGYRIEKGMQVWFCPWAMHRDPRWFADPDEFLPERWEGDFQKTLHRYAYFPFGGGPRFCIGQAFAQMEAVLILATLARSFELDVLAKPRAIPEPSVTLRPKHGVHVRLRKRPAPQKVAVASASLS